MICELSLFGNFLTTWFALSAAALVSIMGMSGTLFYYYYANPTYEQWRYKSNPKFPEPEKVRMEIIQMLKGMCTGTFCPAASLYLSERGLSQAYCGVGEHGWGYLVTSFFAMWLASDFFEFYYHYLGHKYDFFWNNHKHHHVFYNPTPFSVIADEYIDQFVRSSPMLIFPLLAPVNIDLMFLQFAIFFYAYGTYLHWGYEFSWLDPNGKILNTSFQHYLHHAKSINRKPYHCGFMFKIWDQMFGSMYHGEDLSAYTAVAKGQRTREEYEKIHKPDYSVLLSASWWMNPGNSKAQKTM